MATPNYLYAIAINTLFIALRYEQIGLQMADGVCATGGWPAEWQSDHGAVGGGFTHRVVGCCWNEAVDI